VSLLPEHVTASNPKDPAIERIRKGAPYDAAEAEDIALQILREYGSIPLEMQAELKAALLRIVLAKQLHEETYDARAKVIEIVATIKLG
jgi:type III secretion system FlhB-like substrate exporter